MAPKRNAVASTRRWANVPSKTPGGAKPFWAPKCRPRPDKTTNAATGREGAPVGAKATDGA
eukprot:299414-Lingulodinium_polyedra.AAC.1